MGKVFAKLRSWGPFFRGVAGAIAALVAIGVVYVAFVFVQHIRIDHRDHHVLVGREIQRIQQERGQQPSK